MSYGPQFLHGLMNMGPLLGTILGTILNYKREPLMSTVEGPLIMLIWTVAHMSPCMQNVESA